MLHNCAIVKFNGTAWRSPFASFIIGFLDVVIVSAKVIFDGRIIVHTPVCHSLQNHFPMKF